MPTSKDNRVLKTIVSPQPRLVTPLPRLLPLPLATLASQVLAEEPRLEIQGVLTKDKFQPQTARDKMRLMFEQKEGHRKEKEKLEEHAKKKSKAGAKENTNKAGK